MPRTSRIKIHDYGCSWFNDFGTTTTKSANCLTAVILEFSFPDYPLIFLVLQSSLNAIL